MSYHNDPIGAIEADLECMEKDLEGLNEVYRAVNVLLSTDRNSVERNLMTVHEAAKVVANADLKYLIGADLKSITLPEIKKGLERSIGAVTDERDSFVNAQNELFAWNRGQTIKWLRNKREDRLKKCSEHKIGSHEYVRALGQHDAYRACLEQLENVKAKYVE